MKILIVSYFFPPYNVIGAVRVGKLAEYWSERGHDVRVIAANNQPLAKTLKTKLPSDKIIYTNWINVNKLPELVLGGRKKVMSHGFSSKSSILGKLGLLYKTCFNLPDGQIGWYPYATSSAKSLIASGWQPDLIYASAHPLTSLLVAKRLSTKFDIPWVAEFRDLWTDNQNYKYPSFRKWIESKLESFVLSNASAAVTVSEPLAETLQKKVKVPVSTILNGFDPEDYQVSANKLFNENVLNIVYTGMVYAGKQDVSALFAALKLLKYPDNIRIHFYGRYLLDIKRMAEQNDVLHIVSISESVPYDQAIQIQMQTDILLFLLWNDQLERGVYTGKLFEYFGARHPILAIGGESGVAGDLILDREAGMLSNDPVKIANQLDEWINLKLNNRYNFVLPEHVSSGLTRKEQFSRLDCFLKDNKLLYEVF